MTDDILIGYGEVGQALEEVLGERRHICIHDPAKQHTVSGITPEWMHVAIPYSDDFIGIVHDYAYEFKPKYIAIHSTVKIGTTRKIRESFEGVYYSPVRGRHPDLARHVRAFPKWYAASTLGEEDEAFSSYFAQAGIQTRRAPSYEFLEWAKLWETTSYGYNLVMWQEIERQAKKIPGNKHQNLSFLKSWFFEKKKVYDGDLGAVPIYDLVPGPIGGHCIMPNVELLREHLTPVLYRWLTESNDMRKDE